MKKLAITPAKKQVSRYFKYLIMTKITLILTLIFSTQLFAEGIGQNVTVKFEKIELKKALKRLEGQSPYRFVYKDDVLRKWPRVTLSMENVPFTTVLDKLLENTTLQYQKVGNTLLVLSSDTEGNFGLKDMLQAVPIRGKVSSTSGEPLQGVSVIEKGTTNGTVTNEFGDFTLSVSISSVLIFQMLGYLPQEVQVSSISGTNEIHIVLEPSALMLDEVIAIGYGEVKRSDLTGAISVVGTRELETRVNTNPYNMLAGKVPGLNIYNNNGIPGGDISFNIRGFSSINGSNTPLVLVDGVETGNLAGYNPSDIASVSVLKDASATAIYGSRGSNGVILVTTKKPKHGFNIDYVGNVSAGVPARHIDMLDANGYMELFKRMWNYDPARGDYDAVIKPRLHTDYPDLFDENNMPIYNTDWQKATLRTAVSYQNHLSITHGTDRSKTGIYLGLINQNGLIRSDYQKKFTYRFISEYNLSSWLKVGGELNGYTINQNILGSQGVGTESVGRQILEIPSILPPYFPDGHYSTNRDWGYDATGAPAWYLSGGKNALAISDNTLRLQPSHNSDLRVNLSAIIKIADGLEFQSRYTNETVNGQNFDWRSIEDIGTPNGVALGSNYKTSAWTSQNYLTYSKNFKKDHNLSVMGGAEWSTSSTLSMNARSTGYTATFYQYYNLGLGSLPPTVGSGFSKRQTNSFFGRLNYDYDNRYLLTLTSRYDGASMFGTHNKYAFFPSAAIGWIVSREKFMENNASVSDIISFLKLRASYGTTGNSPGLYSSLGTIGTYTLTLNDQLVKGLGLGGAPNASLRWEKTGQFDIGTDIELLNSRIQMTVDWYYKKTKDLLFNVPVSLVSGYSSVTANVGSVQNKGLEVTLGGNIIQKRDVLWSVNAQLAANRNKVLKLGSTDADVITSGFLGSATMLRVGKPMGSFIGVQRLGTWGTHEVDEAARYGKKPGDIKRLDVNNDLTFDQEDMQFLGSPFANYDMTLSTGVRFKNWTFDVDIQIRQGNKIENIAILTIEDRTWYASGYASILKNAWTPDNQNTMVPAIRTAFDPWNTDFGSFADSYWIVDGSFVRGRSLNLGYDIGKRVLERIKIKRLQVYGNIDNFFLIDNLDKRIFDPENSSWGGGYALQGQTFYDTPRPRTYTLGIKASF